MGRDRSIIAGRFCAQARVGLSSYIRLALIAPLSGTGGEGGDRKIGRYNNRIAEGRAKRERSVVT
jgi:hypothetical protein